MREDKNMWNMWITRVKNKQSEMHITNITTSSWSKMRKKLRYLNGFVFGGIYSLIFYGTLTLVMLWKQRMSNKNHKTNPCIHLNSWLLLSIIHFNSTAQHSGLAPCCFTPAPLQQSNTELTCCQDLSSWPRWRLFLRVCTCIYRTVCYSSVPTHMKRCTLL